MPSSRISSSRNSRCRSPLLVVAIWMLRVVATTHFLLVQRAHSFTKSSVGRNRHLHQQQQLFSRLFCKTKAQNARPLTIMSSTTPTAATTATTTTTNVGAKRVRLPEDLQESGARLRAGDLVAFPTETVYGLGCNALDPCAIQKVFLAKERPASDPLISHVLTKDQALPLWKAGSNVESAEYQILSTLCDAFWPGPLTLVAQADAATVPDSLMAGTGYCAVRSPLHETARLLIAAAGVPIAAPSANKFGHVSPTTAHHVWDDLQDEDVWIVQDEINNAVSDSGASSKTCQVGVESTVAKLEMIMEETAGTSTTAKLTVLRQGAVSVAALQAALDAAGFDQVPVTSVRQATADHVAHVAPGQTIRHYSPHIASFLISDACAAAASATTTPLTTADTVRLQSCIVMDFGQRLQAYKQHCLEYRDLSETGDSAEACAAVFETLRWAEQVADAQTILFPDLPVVTDDALAMALKDRLTRAASGVVWETLWASDKVV